MNDSASPADLQSSPPSGRASSWMRGRTASVLDGVFSLLVTLFGLALITFLIGRAMPIDPAVAIAGDQAPTAAIEKLRIEMGLDRPLAEQFIAYLGQIAGGDLGTSVMTRQSVTADIARFFPATLELATSAMLIALVIGIPLGVAAAARQGTLFDNAVRVICLAGQSLPIFVIALVCLLIFYVKLDIAPGTGRQGVAYMGLVEARTGILVIDALMAGQWDAARDALRHLAMPSLLLAYYSFSIIARMTRSFMLDVLRSEYVITARAIGLSRSRILWRHCFPNIAGRLVAVIALTYASLLEGAVLTETVFSWPGLGLYMTRSLLNADLNAVLGATLVIGTIYVCLNLFADFAQRALDPRTR